MLGGAVGIITTSRLIKWLLENYGYVVVSILIGFVVGSLVRIWPWRLNDLPVLPRSYISVEFLGVILLILTGAVIVAAFYRLSQRAP